MLFLNYILGIIRHISGYDICYLNIDVVTVIINTFFIIDIDDFNHSESITLVAHKYDVINLKYIKSNIKKQILTRISPELIILYVCTNRGLSLLYGSNYTTQ